MASKKQRKARQNKRKKGRSRSRSAWYFITEVHILRFDLMFHLVNVCCACDNRKLAQYLWSRGWYNSEWFSIKK